MDRLPRAVVFSLLVALGTAPLEAAQANAESRSGKRSEIAALKAQVEALQKCVARLESRLDASEKLLETRRRGAAPPDAGRIAATVGAPPRPDPLATLEASLGYGSSSEGRTTAATAQRSGPAPAPPAASTSIDPLATVERDISRIKVTGAGAGNARTAFNPQISVIQDMVYRSSRLPADIEGAPDDAGSLPGDPGRSRFDLREVEVSLQAPVDPWTRLDVFLALPGITEGAPEPGGASAERPAQQIEVEEAYATYSRLPWGLQLKGGKFRLEFGKDNLMHLHSFLAADRPRVIGNFLGPEGIRDQGLSLMKQFELGSPRTQLELTGQLVNSDGDESLFAGIDARRPMTVARARLYHEFDDSSNLDLGCSMISGRHDAEELLAQRIWGYDLTFRWEPVERSIYTNFLFRAEYLKGVRELIPVAPDAGAAPGREWLEPDGLYAMAHYQFQRDMSVGVRYDNTDIARSLAASAAEGVFIPHSRLRGPSVWYTYLPTEFNRFRVQYSHLTTDFAFGGDHRGDDLVLLSWTTSMGPHGAHRY
ncbi:MAG: bZIP transcription factor [Candidatus Riflebacteria bacterium]|nr:bZIP transcription factor [Candidatus Riflebacteria bacterium]